MDVLRRLKDCLAKRPQTLKGLLGVKEDLALWLATPLGMVCIWTRLKRPEKIPIDNWQGWVKSPQLYI